MNTKEQLMAFYEKCEVERVYNLDDPFLERKAVQIASSMGINVTDIHEYFAKAKDVTVTFRRKEKEKKDAEIRKASIEKAKIDDSILLDKYSAYSDCYGNEKIIKMTTDDYLVSVNPLKKKQKEHLHSKDFAINDSLDVVRA